MYELGGHIMIKVQVKFYPPFCDFAGKRQVDVELNEGDKFIDLLSKLGDIFPDFKKAIPDTKDKFIFYNNMVPVINGNVVNLQKVLNNGDVICLFGSISGG